LTGPTIFRERRAPGGQYDHYDGIIVLSGSQQRRSVITGSSTDGICTSFRFTTGAG
jgi:hypothetical protein